MANHVVEEPSYNDLCAVGRSRADELVERMREDENPLYLLSAAREVGELTPTQIGLFSQLACMLIRH